MRQLQLQAYGKINLTLDVLGKRPDGYHLVEMIMQSIQLHDNISLIEKAGRGIEIHCPHPYVPNDERNLAYRAARLIYEKSGIDRGLIIEIDKQIPVAAGLAGGSTDAAAVLRGLNKLWNLGFGLQELQEMGKKLGADVPFCIRGGTVLAQGIGTDLTPLEPMPPMELILVKPNMGVSTREIYANYQPSLIKRRPDLEQMVEAIRQGDGEKIQHSLVNVLEDITFQYYPQTARIKRKIERIGLWPVLMSGSGPTLFTLLTSANEADRFAALLEEYLDCQVIRTRTQGSFD